MHSIAHGEAVETDLVQRGFQDLERYLKSQREASASVPIEAIEEVSSSTFDDPRRVGLDELERFIERQRALNPLSLRS